MKRSFYLVAVILVLSALMLSACGGGAPAADSGKQRGPTPAEYAGKKNPMAGSADAATAGKALYDVNCASCHGEKGAGDGPAGASLSPKPYNLAKAITETDEAYIYYRIAEGGMMDPYKSSMPAWKDILSEDEIWQIITHIQTFK